MSNITYDYILEFIRGLEPVKDDYIYELEKEAHKNEIPIIHPEVKSFITTILAMKKPKYILEIGTAVGYSAIVMSNYLQDKGKIITIERNPKMSTVAYENIKKTGLEDKIKILEGSADEILSHLDNKFDFIFIDAAKGQYNVFWQHSKRLLNDNGIIVADNVLHKGMVAKSRYSIPRRQRTIHSRMRTFLKEVLKDENFKSSILPIGDGITISYKKGVNLNE